MSRRTLTATVASLALLALAASAVPACRREPTVTLRVAAGSDLSPAFEALGGEFTRSESVGIAWEFGTSAALASQLAESSPSRYDVFVTTDTSQVGRLVSLGRCEDLSRTFAGFATLVLVTAPSAPRVDAVQSIADARFTRIALMHPEHGPFGRAAMQVLTSLGIYDAVASRLVFEDSARAVLDRVRAGTVQAAIVPRGIVTEGDSLAIPADLYRAIEQVAVSCTRDAVRHEAAARLLQYLHEGEGKALLEGYGFVFP